MATVRTEEVRLPFALRGPLEYGQSRTAHYRSIIARFGRFPHRNAILGRASTPDELAFLAEQAKRVENA